MGHGQIQPHIHRRTFPPKTCMSHTAVESRWRGTTSNALGKQAGELRMADLSMGLITGAYSTLA
jgi:hypothetical protein